MTYTQIAHRMSLLPLDDMTQQEIADTLGVSRLLVSRAISETGIHYRSKLRVDGEFVGAVRELLGAGCSDDEISAMLDCPKHRVSYVRLSVLGEPRRIGRPMKQAILNDYRKIENIISRKKESELIKRKSLLTLPKIEVGDIIDVQLEDEDPYICSVKLKKVEGIHYIFEARSGWLYAMTREQLLDALAGQEPRKEWRR